MECYTRDFSKFLAQLSKFVFCEADWQLINTFHLWRQKSALKSEKVYK